MLEVKIVRHMLVPSLLVLFTPEPLLRPEIEFPIPEQIVITEPEDSADESVPTTIKIDSLAIGQALAL